MIDKECAWVVGWVHNLGCCWFVIYSLTVVGGDREHREQVDRREREHVIRIQMSEGNSQLKYSHSSMSQRVGQQSSCGEWKWSISEDLRVIGGWLGNCNKSGWIYSLVVGDDFDLDFSSPFSLRTLFIFPSYFMWVDSFEELQFVDQFLMHVQQIAKGETGLHNTLCS